MTRIFDNIGLDLATHLKNTLMVSDQMDVAVGYFNLRGWSLFDSIIKEKSTKRSDDSGPLVRILIGMVMAGPQQEALAELQGSIDATKVSLEADANDARQRKMELLEHLRVQLMSGLPTQADRAALQSLRDLIAQGAVEIKVFTRRPLHGKTYILHRANDPNNPITGFVGSSNFTVPGMTLNRNYELNVDVVDTVGAQTLAKWFDERWTDRFSRPVTTDLLALLDESWARKIPRRPYEVFIKVCHDLSRDVREGLAEYSIPVEMANLLLVYQGTAVQTLARRIINKRGTMLGDVAGLGKTLCAIAVSLMLREEYGYTPLVLCPKNLVKMWEKHLAAYGLDGGRVIHYNLAHTMLPELTRYRFVIIDESHTLRNEARQDYRAIKEYIDVNESKVLLLTATPYNIDFSDVANQLALYVSEDDDLGIEPVNAMAADPKIVDRVDGKTTTLAAFRNSNNADDWKRLMSEHLVRRTRSFIRDNFSLTDEDGNQYLEFADGTRFQFPTRTAIPIDHSFGPDDPAAEMASDSTLDTINNLLLPRYQLARYVSQEAVPTETEREFIENLTRGRGHVAGFVRTTFYKRLSSCGHSFLLSLKRHITRNELFIFAIDNEVALPTGSINESIFDTDLDADSVGLEYTSDTDVSLRYDALANALPAGLTWVSPGLFTAQLREDLIADNQALEAMIARFGNWELSSDSKLQALIKLVTVTHRIDKVLIFTEYKDTADYVGGALRSAGVEAVGVATGESENPTELARRFAPRSNALPGEQVDLAGVDELRVLVATDVLSEGHNLQDGHIVVNYDLPWAIIRLIQRAGRVDRVGQDSKTVLIYSFFHESIDNVIALRQRIIARLSTNAEAFGADEQFFGSDREVQTVHDLYSGKLDDFSESDDVDASSLAYQYWLRAVEADDQLAARIAALPDLLSATRSQRISDEGSAGVVCYVRTESGIDGFGKVDPAGTTRRLTGHEVLRALEAKPEEEGQELRPDHDDLVRTLVQGELSTPHVAAGRLRGVRRQLWNRLGENLTLSSLDKDAEAALDDIYQHPLTRDAENRLRKAMKAGSSDEDLVARIALMHRDGNLVIQSHSSKDAVRIVSSMGIADV